MKNDMKNHAVKLLAAARKQVSKPQGRKLVAIALAATTRLSAQAAEQLMDVPFSSRKIGLKDKASIRSFKKNLAALLPAGTAAIARIPEEPGLHAGDVADYVSKIINATSAAVQPLLAAPAVVVKAASAEYRKTCADRFGKAFAEKASDRMIQALSVRMYSASREAVAQSSQAMLVEFTSPELPAASVIQLSGRESVMLTAGSRAQRIASLKEVFYSAVSPIRAELERKFTRFADSFRESIQDQGPATDVCWLNATLRAIGPVKDLAEMADDPKIHRIGIPRALVRELNLTGKTVGSIAFRNASGFTGKGIQVAVIDGEVDSMHPSLKGRVMQKKNYTKEAWGKPDQHATGVAGIIASAHASLTGMAPAAMIANYKVFATNAQDQGSDFDATLAIQQALEDGVLIANCSWGVGPATDGTSREARAFNRAWDLGLVIVKSAGNKGPSPGTLTSPADARGVIAVAATDRKGKHVQDYSSRGPIAVKPGPDLAAPGGGADRNGIRSLTPGGGTGSIGQGTSFASPHVAGLIALLLEQNPTMTPDAVKTRLLSKCVLLPGTTPADCGAGLLVI